MRGATSAFLRDLALLVAVVLLALLPGALPGTVSGLLLALVLPGYAASGVLKQSARLDSLPEIL